MMDINQALASLADYFTKLTHWASLALKTRKKKAQPKVQQEALDAFEKYLRSYRSDDETTTVKDETLDTLIKTLPLLEHRAHVPSNILAMLGCIICRNKQSAIKHEFHGELEVGSSILTGFQLTKKSWLDSMTREEAREKNAEWTEEWVDLLWHTFANPDWEIRIGAINMLSKLQENESAIKQVVMRFGNEKKILLDVGDALMTAPEFRHIASLTKFVSMLLPKKGIEERVQLFVKKDYMSRALVEAFVEFTDHDNISLALALNDERQKHGTALPTLELQDVSLDDGDEFFDIDEGHVIASATTLTVLFLLKENWSTWNINFAELADTGLSGQTVILKSKTSFDCTGTRLLHLLFASLDLARETLRQLPSALQPPVKVRTAFAEIRVPPNAEQIKPKPKETFAERAAKLTQRVGSMSPMEPLPPAPTRVLGRAMHDDIDETPQEDEPMQSLGDLIAKTPVRSGTRVSSNDSTRSPTPDPVRQVLSQPLANEPVTTTIVQATMTQTQVVETVASVLATQEMQQATAEDAAAIFQIAPPRSAQRRLAGSQASPEGAVGQTSSDLTRETGDQATPAKQPEHGSPTSLTKQAETQFPATFQPRTPSAASISKQRIVPHNSKVVDSLLNDMASYNAHSLVRRQPTITTQDVAPISSIDMGPDVDAAQDQVASPSPAPIERQNQNQNQPQPQRAKSKAKAKGGPKRGNERIVQEATIDPAELSDVSSPTPPPIRQSSPAPEATPIRARVVMRKMKRASPVVVEEGVENETDYDIPDSPTESHTKSKGKSSKKANKKKAPAKKKGGQKTAAATKRGGQTTKQAPATVTARTTRAQAAKEAEAEEQVSDPETEQVRRSPRKKAQTSPSKANGTKRRRKDAEESEEDELSLPAKKHVSPLSLPRVEHLVNENAVKRPDIVHWTKEGPQRNVLPVAEEDVVVRRGQVAETATRVASSPELMIIDQDQEGPDERVVGQHEGGLGMPEVEQDHVVPGADLAEQVEVQEIIEQTRTQSAVLPTPSQPSKIVSPRVSKKVDSLRLQKLISSDSIEEVDEPAGAFMSTDQNLTPNRRDTRTVPQAQQKMDVPRRALSDEPSSAFKKTASMSKKAMTDAALTTPVKDAPSGHKTVAEESVRPPARGTPTTRSAKATGASFVTPALPMTRARAAQSTSAQLSAATSTVQQLQNAIDSLPGPKKRFLAARQAPLTPTRGSRQLARQKQTATPALVRPSGPAPRAAQQMQLQLHPTVSLLHTSLEKRGLLPDATDEAAAGVATQPSTEDSSSEDEAPRSKRAKRSKDKHATFRQSLSSTHRNLYDSFEQVARDMVRNVQQSEASILEAASIFSAQCDGVLEAYRESCQLSSLELVKQLKSSIQGSLAL